MMSNNMLSAIVHSIDEWRLTADDEKGGEILQRGMEKFQRERDGDLVGPLCSRNPHDETVVVRRAQWWTKPGHREARLAHDGRGRTSEHGGSICIGGLCGYS
jgi:hypothetical protein